jgi:hypothetical protein
MLGGDPDTGVMDQVEVFGGTDNEPVVGESHGSDKERVAVNVEK